MRAALPSLFVSHGSPLHALAPGAVGEIWAHLGRGLPAPRAVLVVSAHWETALPAITGGAALETIHDFYGFPEPLYRLRYPAPGSPELAARAAGLLAAAGLAAAMDERRGLDHGAWAPLLHMYPEAAIPVIQVSVQTALGPAHHVTLGRALAPLAAEGVLLVGSGHMTHNLRDRLGDGAPPLGYVLEFQRWVDERIARGALEELVDYRRRAPHAERAHPTEEHFLPLFFALGVAGDDYRSERLYDGVESGALAMDAYRLLPA